MEQRSQYIVSLHTCGPTNSLTLDEVSELLGYMVLEPNIFRIIVTDDLLRKWKQGKFFDHVTRDRDQAVLNRKGKYSDYLKNSDYNGRRSSIESNLWVV